MHLFKCETKNILPLYNKIIFLTRKIFFYDNFNLSDSFSNRIYLVFFHLSFVLISLNHKENDTNKQQTIFDFFFKQIESNCRELGYSDTTINKKMKKLITLFYEILFQCKNWNQLKINKTSVLKHQIFYYNYLNLLQWSHNYLSYALKTLSNHDEQLNVISHCHYYLCKKLINHEHSYALLT